MVVFSQVCIGRLVHVIHASFRAGVQLDAYASGHARIPALLVPSTDIE
jgi:hypothetical protein